MQYFSTSLTRHYGQKTSWSISRHDGSSMDVKASKGVLWQSHTRATLLYSWCFHVNPSMLSCVVDTTTRASWETEALSLLTHGQYKFAIEHPTDCPSSAGQTNILRPTIISSLEKWSRRELCLSRLSAYSVEFSWLRSVA